MIDLLVVLLSVLLSYANASIQELDGQATTSIENVANDAGATQFETPLSEKDFSVRPEFAQAIESLDASLESGADPGEEKRIRDRLVAIGLVGGTLLALLGVLFGYLRLDHATRGFYCARLQMLAGICSALILGACYFLWTQVLFK